MHDTLELAIAAAVADGRVVRLERAIVDAIASELGVSARDVDGRVSRALSRARDQTRRAPRARTTPGAVPHRDTAERESVSGWDTRDPWRRA